MIKNFNSLANTKVKKKALQILEAGLTAAEPKNFLKEFVSKNHISLGKNRIFLSNYGKIFVVAYGKASDSMAEYVSKKIYSQIVILVNGKNHYLIISLKLSSVLELRKQNQLLAGRDYKKSPLSVILSFSVAIQRRQLLALPALMVNLQ